MLILMLKLVMRIHLQGVQHFGIPKSHWKKNCLEPHVKYIVTRNHKKILLFLSKFTILCWATFIAILGHMWPMGRGLDTPDYSMSHRVTSGIVLGRTRQSSSSTMGYTLHIRPCVVFIHFCGTHHWLPAPAMERPWRNLPSPVSHTTPSNICAVLCSFKILFKSLEILPAVGHRAVRVFPKQESGCAMLLLAPCDTGNENNKC